MSLGTLYGIGIGPGDPELMTVKGARLLSEAKHIFVPRGHEGKDSVAHTISAGYFSKDAEVHEIVFHATRDSEGLDRYWHSVAEQVAEVLQTGEDVCFVTLGDALFYSTYIYLIWELRKILPDLVIDTVPGISAYSAVSSLVEFPLGYRKNPVVVIPADDEMGALKRAMGDNCSIAIMKVGNHFEKILEILEENNLVEKSVFVVKVGLPEQRVVWDLRSLKGKITKKEYLSIILVNNNAD